MGMLKSQQSFLPRPQPLPLDGRGERCRWEGRAVLFLCFLCFLCDIISCLISWRFKVSLFYVHRPFLPAHRRGGVGGGVSDIKTLRRGKKQTPSPAPFLRPFGSKPASWSARAKLAYPPFPLRGQGERPGAVQDLGPEHPFVVCRGSDQ